MLLSSPATWQGPPNGAADMPTTVIHKEIKEFKKYYTKAPKVIYALVLEYCHIKKYMQV